jgi:hypothetical protein
MLHLDFQWDLTPNGILLDSELDTDKLGWQQGDMFKLVNVNGKQMLIKVDPVVAFSKGYRVNFQESEHAPAVQQTTYLKG